MQHLLSKVRYCLPYFINLMLNEINSKARKNNKPAIAITDINNAFEEVVKNSDHFKDWKSRLFDYMPLPDAEFVNEVLIYIAHTNAISKQKLYDIAIRHGKKNNYMDFIDDLEEDGYIIIDNFRQGSCDLAEWPNTEALIEKCGLKTKVYHEPEHPDWKTLVISR